jgi:hypothetical protein
MIDFKKLAKTTRLVAENMPLYRIETRSDLLQVADFLDTLIESDPEAASSLPAEVSETSAETSVDATKGPGSSLCFLVFRGKECNYVGKDTTCDHTFESCRAKHNTHNWQAMWPEFEKSSGPALILKLEETEFE